MPKTIWNNVVIEMIDEKIDILIISGAGLADTCLYPDVIRGFYRHTTQRDVISFAITQNRNLLQVNHASG